MRPQLRDTLVHDFTATSGSSFDIDFPTVGAGGLINVGDWGAALLVWSANSSSPLTGLQSNWDTLIPPTLANGICLALVVSPVDNVDITTGTYITKTVIGSGGEMTDVVVDVPDGVKRLTIASGKGIRLLSVSAWYSGMSRMDRAAGKVGSSNTVLTTSVAPSVIASGVQDEIVLAFFATMIRNGPGVVTLDRSTVRADGHGSANTVRGIISELPVPTLGPTGDITATYDFGMPSRAAVQLAVFPLNPSIGGVPEFKPTVTLSAVGIGISAGNVNFPLSVKLEATGLVGGSGQFTPTVRLSVWTKSISPASFGVTVGLTATGAKKGDVSFSLAVRLATQGGFNGKASVSFAPSVRLSASGQKQVFSAAVFGTNVTLSTLGIATKEDSPNFSTVVRLSTAGTPSLLGISASFGTSVRLFTQYSVVFVAGRPQFGFALQLRAQASLISVAASAHFTSTVKLTAVGIASFDPVGQASFISTVTLAVDGFTRPAHPVGITVKPVKVQADPEWHGRLKNEYEWQSDLPVGVAGLGATVTLEADGFDPSEAVVATSSSIFWSTE